METLEERPRRQSDDTDAPVEAGVVRRVGVGDPRAPDGLAFGDLKSGDGAGADLAHDFRNLAMSVVSAANLLQRCSDDSARVAQIAKLLRETGERAVAISRRSPPRP